MGCIQYDIGMRKINIIIRKNKNLIALFLVATFLISIPYVSYPMYGKSATDKKNEAQQNLNKVEDQMNNIKDKQDQVNAELKDVKKQLSQLMSKQNELEADIKETENALNKTQEELAVAKKEADEQYEAMKLRIQYMYENSSNDSIWTAILEADGIADMLNRVEYVSTIYESDRALTEQYKETIVQVQEQQTKLSNTRDELLAKQEVFLGQQLEIEEMVDSLQDTKNEYASQLATAKKQAEAYKKTIKEQEEIIRREQAANQSPSYNGKNVSGEVLVAYGRQFLGNPYVWGGNSLTNGCDCSGFVHLVYKHFGYNLVRYSLSFLNEGVPVSIENIKVGDIVVYAKSAAGIGHVAIYAGNGKIIEAQSGKAGITDNRPLQHGRKILGIRRVLPNP